MSDPILLTEKRILILLTTSTLPEFNLALEDILLQGVEEKSLPRMLVRFWKNTDCLVTGQTRHISYGWYREDEASRLGVRVLKRSTGGGVVFHDLGNLNWSFYIRKESGGFIPPIRLFAYAAGIICGTLREFGLEAFFTPPNRIDLMGFKISGMAARAKLNSVLIHGTLLISTDLEKLNRLCIHPPGCPPVTNLSQLNPEITATSFVKAFLKHLTKKGCDYEVFETEDFVKNHVRLPKMLEERGAKHCIRDSDYMQHQTLLNAVKNSMRGNMQTCK